jgi:hypothetical protein
MKFERWTKQAWTMTALGVAAIAGAGASATVLSGCASEEPPAEATEQSEDDLSLFPDPACPGPITMSKRSFASLPAGYESLTAAAKQAQLWKVVSESAYTPRCRPSSGLFLAALAAPGTIATMSTSLDRASDELPVGRRKMVHPFGTVAAFDFVKDPPVAGGPSYTGILAAGGAPVHGIMRASLGGDPNVLGFTPGIGLKFLVDGKTSVNVVVMNSLMGQKNDTNFLRKPLSNEVPDPHAGLDRGNWLDWAKADSFALGQNLAFLPAMAQGPEHATPNFLHVDHLATRAADGNVVPQAERSAPSHLVFRAPPALVAWWDRPENRGIDYRDMLAGLSAGTDLYEVYARATPASPEVRIGVLKTTTAFVASTWGDYRLFFRHNDHQKNGDVAR